MEVSGDCDRSPAASRDPDAAGDRLYDFQGHGEDVPVRLEVPLSTVRAVLTAYLDHDGLVPDDFPDLHQVDVE